MGKNASKRRGQKLTAKPAPAAPAALKHVAFTVAVSFDPERPDSALANVLPMREGDEPLIEDVIAALRMVYETTLTRRGMALASSAIAQQKQVAAAQKASVEAENAEIEKREAKSK